MATANAREAREGHKFSRRHQTSAAHEARRQRRLKMMLVKQQRAQGRAEEAAKRTPQDQIRRLDDRFGFGEGAERERARLKARIEEEEKISDRASAFRKSGLSQSKPQATVSANKK